MPNTWQCLSAHELREPKRRCGLVPPADQEEKLKVERMETASLVAARGAECEERVEVLRQSVMELQDRLKAYEIRNEEWPKPGEGNDDKIRIQKKISFGEKFKNKAKDTVLVVGDSLMRGVGKKLQTNSNMFSSICIGGAKIDDVAEVIDHLKDNDDRHLVLMVGTNDIKTVGSEEVFRNFEKLMGKCTSVKNRVVTMIGIPTRYDIDNTVSSRRINMNIRLQKLCEETGVKFLEYECYRSRVGRDGLHLNERGQEELAMKVFTHCKHFLV